MLRAPAMAGDTRWNGTAGMTVRRRRTAHYRVTNASGEERSGWSLETFGHVRRDAAGDEGSEVISQLDRIESDGLRRDCRTNAAGSTGAALVQRAFDEVGFADVRVSDTGLVRIRLGGVVVTCRAMMTVGDGVGPIVFVLPHAAGDHRRRSHALHRQSDCQQERQGEASESRHRPTLNDRPAVRKADSTSRVSA